MSAPDRALNATPDEVRRTDAVVVGAGAAGLSAALGLAPRNVTVLTSTTSTTGGSTPLAQGGIAAAVGSGDRPSDHAADTIAVSAGLADQEIVARITDAAPGIVSALRDAGVGFDSEPGGRPLLGLEAGHRRRRVLHAGGDATGEAIARALAAAVHVAPGVELVHGARAVDLVVESGQVVGVMARHADGRLVLHAAPAVVLATGGLGGLYERTTNPPESSGAGLALAARAGARLVDLEFVQFHPTALAVGGGRQPLLTEALRGEGARLVDAAGQPLMTGVHPAGDLAPRDVLAREIGRALAAGRQVHLDARPALRAPDAFPTVRSLCAAHGLDPTAAPVPVAPAAHYHMGGVAVDGDGRTTVAGLWACGEVAGTGMHGANRLASNSLLEAVYTGGRVAASIARSGLTLSRLVPAVARTPIPDVDAGEAAATVTEVRRILWERVGVQRDAVGLRAALHTLDRLRSGLPEHGEAADATLVAALVARAALERTESRGAHQRADHPATDPRWLQRITVTLEGRALRTGRADVRARTGAVA